MSVFTELYESTKRSRDAAREAGLVFESCLFTQHMCDIIEQFDLDTPIEDLELTQSEGLTWADWLASQDDESEPPPEDHTAWNKVMRCLEALYQAYWGHGDKIMALTEFTGHSVQLRELMGVYDEWLG